MPAACRFCASLVSFQKDKDIAKEERSSVNTTLAFAALPGKIQQEAKQVEDDNGLSVATYTSTCQELSKPRSWLSTATPSWTISYAQGLLFRNTADSTGPARHVHIHRVLRWCVCCLDREGYLKDKIHTNAEDFTTECNQRCFKLYTLL